MTLTIHSSFLPHLDADESLAFYRDVLDFEVRQDVGSGRMRWITVGPAGQPDTNIVLEPPALDPNLSDEERQTIQRLVERGAYARILLETDNLEGVLAQATESGTEIVQTIETKPYGVRDCAFKDPAGNLIRIQQAN